ncbi:hypothetical protein [Nitrosopumilus sp.]|uniref:hypothetical protein n=1 Tax=Nitrosopumilus sp. TaxID=2024843 RepID=UPI00292E1BFA|nr:hypothetical protein [Nitrosopumilus sp.]
MRNNSVEKNSPHSLLYYRRKVVANSVCSKIMILLYPDNSMTLKEISSVIDKSRSYSKKIILQMNHSGYLGHDNKPYNRRYQLSQTGRWFAICGKLNVSFQALCILSKVYLNSKDNRHYMISMYRRNFDESCDEFYSIASAIYSYRNISRSIKMLTDKFLVYWESKDMLKITPNIMQYLKEYDGDLTSLSSWIDDVSILCHEKRLENIKIDDNTKNILCVMNPKDPI